jgi:hypothetical protein
MDTSPAYPPGFELAANDGEHPGPGGREWRPGRIFPQILKG